MSHSRWPATYITPNHIDIGKRGKECLVPFLANNFLISVKTGGNRTFLYPACVGPNEEPTSEELLVLAWRVSCQRQVEVWLGWPPHFFAGATRPISKCFQVDKILPKNSVLKFKILSGKPIFFRFF